MGNQYAAGWKPGDPIGYVRKDIPDFDVPAYEGTRYEALAPDTLDLQERAALAVNVLTRATDPLADYEQYFYARFRQNPPMMQHDYADQCQNRFMEGLPLMRIISGSDLNTEVDRRWMEVALRRLGPDDICYTPFVGRPWALIGGAHYNVTPEEGDQFIEPFFSGRLLSAMVLYHVRDGSPLWRQEAQRLVDGLADLAVDRGSYAFYAPSAHYAKKGSTDEFGKSYPLMGAHVGFVVMGLVHVYRQTGYERAIELSGKLIRYLLDELHYFGSDGSFTPDRPPDHRPPRTTSAHFHMHTYSLLAMLEFARLTGDAGLLELVSKGYEYGKANGDTLLGYYPENLGSSDFETSELCEVADMIAIGLKLTEAGVGDYWDEVDRWIRNVFAEGQLTPERGHWLERYAAQLPVSAVDPMYQTTDRVVERNVGGFAGWPEPNDWGRAIMHCCTGNGVRGIYNAWDYMLTLSDNKLRVNLLLNRASPWADIDSHIPYVGQVDVKVKQACDLSIRIPEWVTPGETRCQVGDMDRSVEWDGRYAEVGTVKPGDVVTLTFPINERTDDVYIEKRKYTLVRKGNDVVSIDPPGRICPLYEREHYRTDTTRWRKIERFVSNESIHW